MIVIRYNIGSKPHEKEFKNATELGEWVIENYFLKITTLKVI